MLLRDALTQLVTGLPTPQDYFTGVSGPLTTLPHTLLAFVRDQAWLTTELRACHHRYVLVVPLQGQGGVLVDGQLCRLAPGEVLLVCPYQSHYYTQLIDASLRWLFITFEYPAPEELTPLRDHRIPLLPPAEESLLVAMTGYTAGEAERGERAGEIALALAQVLTTCLLATPQPIARLPAPQDARDALIGQVSHFVYQEVSRPLTPGQVAEHVALSESHLRALFRRTVGISLGKFIRQAKIFTACQHLRTTEHSVTEVALACGYDSLFSFSRAFRQTMGVSPQGFRRHTHRRL
jgi:AraC-like DNA-binding protein